MIVNPIFAPSSKIQHAWKLALSRQAEGWGINQIAEELRCNQPPNGTCIDHFATKIVNGQIVVCSRCSGTDSE